MKKFVAAHAFLIAVTLVAVQYYFSHPDRNPVVDAIMIAMTILLIGSSVIWVITGGNNENLLRWTYLRP